MRLFAIDIQQGTSFTVGGTLTILIFGVLFGLGTGVFYVAVRRFLPGPTLVILMPCSVHVRVPSGVITANFMRMRPCSTGSRLTMPYRTRLSLLAFPVFAFQSSDS